MHYSKYNVVIIGSGISGLHLANKLSEYSDLSEGILIITKDKLFSGSSSLAQGGIVSVIPHINHADSVESHVKDTLTAGCGLNNLNTVKYVSENSACAIDNLIRFGVEFDKTDGKLNFTLEGAHSCPRILHSKGDSTGRVIEEALSDRILKADNVQIYENTLATELLIDSNNVCRGVVVYNSSLNSFEIVYSNNIVVATGGIGQVYKTTTNPLTSTGDGISLAYKAGAELENMEFVQFHPTALYCKDKTTTPLISESVRGEGAKLVNLRGEYFAKNYHPLGDLAPRDVVARAINDEITNHGEDYVNLDISQIGIEKFKTRFPTITSICKDNGIDLASGLIPVVPAEHYFMGGIKTDINSKTTIENLYAIGECASSGLHGANRLASNSLLECVVFADSLASFLAKNPIIPPKHHDNKINSIIEKYSNINCTDEYDEIILSKFKLLKELMSAHVGIIRDENGLKDALLSVIELEKSVKNDVFSKIQYEFQNAITVSKEIVKAALNRKESIGAHFRSDYIAQDKTSIELKEEINIKDDKILS